MAVEREAPAWERLNFLGAWKATNETTDAV